MSLTIKESPRGEYKLTSPGTHLAICYLMADLGIQETPFGPKPQVYMGFELPNNLIDRGGKAVPESIGAFYTMSMHEKSNLRHMLEAWRGKPFSDEEIAQGVRLASVVGKACLVTVIHKQTQAGRTRARISAVTGVPAGMPVPAMFNKPILFDRDTGKGLESLPEFLQRLLRPEPTGAPDAFDSGRSGRSIDDADIPF